MKVALKRTRTSVLLWGLILLWVGFPLREHRGLQPPETANIVPSGNDLNLNVDLEQDNARITWNPGAPAIAAGGVGMLSIRDGKFNSETPLDFSELRRGSVVYGPIISSAPTFELHVGAATETFSVIDFRGQSFGKLSPTKEAVSVKEGKALGPDAEVFSATRRTEVAASPKGGDERLDLVKPRLFSAPSPTTIQPSWATSGTLPPTKNPILPEELPPPPDLGLVGDSAPAGRAQLPLSAGVVRAPAPLPDERLIPLSPPEQIEYVAARPLKHVRPSAPASILRLVPSKVTIRVRVYINAEGRVIRAESLSRGGTLVDYLSKLAVTAAQEWQFLPAHRGDRAVDSETVLQFDFESNGSNGGSS